MFDALKTPLGEKFSPGGMWTTLGITWGFGGWVMAVKGFGARSQIKTPVRKIAETVVVADSRAIVIKFED